MDKVTVEDLHRIREKTRSRMAMRDQEAAVRVTVHMGECGIEAGGREVMKALLEEIGKSGRDDIRAFAGDCLGICETEPDVTVEIEGREPVIYQKVDQDKLRRIFERHVLGGDVQEEDTVELPAGGGEQQAEQEG